MLKGVYVHNGHEMVLRGYDISNTIHLRGMCSKMSARSYYDEGIVKENEVFPPMWGFDGIYISIGASTMKVEKMTDYDEFSGKTVANNLNKEAFCDLGSLIRGMKLQCSPMNLQTGGIGDAYDSDKTYVYSVDGGSVSLTHGEITELSYDDGSVRLYLKDEISPAETIQYPDTTHNIRLDLSWYKEEESFGVEELAQDRFYTISEIIEKNPNKSYAWLEGREYHIVKRDDLKDFCMKMATHKGIIAFDTETTGLKMNFWSEESRGDQVVGLVFAWEKGIAYYVPLRHTKVENIAEPRDLSYTMEAYFKPLLERKQFVGHNISFDWKAMWTFGINTNFVADTLSAIRLSVWNDDTSTPLGLKGASQKFLNRDSLELSDFVPGKWNEDRSFADMDEESTKYYACADGDNTLELWLWFSENRILEKYNALKVFQIEVLFSKVIGYSEYYGMYSDPSKLEILQSEMESIVDREYKSMVEILGHDFNPSSPKGLIKALYEEQGVAVTKTTKTGNPSTDKDVLKGLARIKNSDGTPAYPFVVHLQDYKAAKQLISNFINPFHILAQDGFFFSGVQQFLETGRVSISKPNYQSFNDPVKKYIEPRKGFYMLDSDYSSIEYRVLTSMAQEEGLVKQFFDPDFDYHRRMASMLYVVAYELVTSALRSQSKGLNFGIPYGMSAKSLGIRMFGPDDKNAFQKAQKLYNKYFDVQPKVKAFFEKEKEKATSEWYNETFFGRRRSYDRRKAKPDRIRRQAGNHPIQGTAADLYKMGVGRLFNEIASRGLLGKVLIPGFIHDEVLIECHSSINPAVLLDMVRRSLMIEIDGWCPLYTGMGFGMSWYEAKKTELPVQVQVAIQEKGIVDWWDGDGKKLVPWETTIIANFQYDHVVEYLKTGARKGEAIDPTASGFMKDVVKYVSNGGNIERDVVSGAELINSTGPKDDLHNFGALFGLTDLVNSTNIKWDSEGVSGVIEENDRVSPDDIKFDDEDPISILLSRTRQFGAAVDSATSSVFILYREGVPAWNTAVEKLIGQFAGENKLYLVTQDSVFETNFKVKASIGSKVLMLGRAFK